MNQNIVINKLEETDCQEITDSFAAQGWEKPLDQYIRYLREQKNGEKVVLVAKLDGEFAGCLTICWRSNYHPFQEKEIPEVVDLNVLEKFQKAGRGTLLLEEAENVVSEKSKTIGIGVGLFEDYGKAQRLYIKRGYLPDGLGISQKNRFPKNGDEIVVNDDLALHFIKIIG